MQNNHCSHNMIHNNSNSQFQTFDCHSYIFGWFQLNMFASIVTLIKPHLRLLSINIAKQCVFFLALITDIALALFSLFFFLFFSFVGPLTSSTDIIQMSVSVCKESGLLYRVALKQIMSGLEFATIECSPNTTQMERLALCANIHQVDFICTVSITDERNTKTK